MNRESCLFREGFVLRYRPRTRAVTCALFALTFPAFAGASDPLSLADDVWGDPVVDGAAPTLVGPWRIGLVGPAVPGPLGDSKVVDFSGLDPPEVAAEVDLILITGQAELQALAPEQLQAIRDLLYQGVPAVFLGSEQEFAGTLGLPCVDSTPPEPGELFAIRRMPSGAFRRGHFFAAPGDKKGRMG